MKHRVLRVAENAMVADGREPAPTVAQAMTQ
jgi:hypothetical protein